MSFLGSIFQNETIKKAAFSGLRKLMQDEKLTCIVLRNNPEKEDSPIPGFDVDMFREDVVIFPADTIGITSEEYNKIMEIDKMLQGLTPAHFEAWEDPEVRDIINRYLKAKKLTNGTDQSANAGSADTVGDTY